MLLDDTNSANGSSKKIGTILVVGYWPPKNFELFLGPLFGETDVAGRVFIFIQ